MQNMGIFSYDENLENLLIGKNEEMEEDHIMDSSLSPKILGVNLRNISKSIELNGSTYHDYGLGVVLGLSATMVLCMILALVGNLLVILTVIRHKGMKTRTNMFIVNLAVADLLVAIFNMPFSLVTVIHGDWIFGDSFCQFNGFVTPFFLINSIHTLMYISVHKYISISRPFSQTMTHTKILIMICISWIWSSVCATFTLRIGNHVVYKTGASQCGPSIPDELNEHIHSIAITTFNYILPLVVMTFCYIGIFREIHEHMARIRLTSNVNLQNTLNQQRKITCTLFSVLACFLICWTPFILYSCSAAFLTDKDKIPLLANPIAYWCGYMNSACNPIIYALRSPSFRQGYKEIICHYQAYNMGGSLVTRPSISPYGTIRKISSRISPILLKNISPDTGKTTNRKKEQGNPLLANGVLESQSRRERNEILRELQCPLDKFNAKNGFSVSKRKENFCSLPNINDCSTLEESKSLSIMDSKPRLITKYHSFPLISSPHLMKTSFIPEPVPNRPSVSNIELPHNDQIISFGSLSTISKQTSYNGTDEHEFTSCPLVIVDAASLKSSNVGKADDWKRRLSGMLSLTISNNADLGLGFGDDNNLNEGKWSPMSTKSLEMGRSRRSSSHTSKRLLAINARNSNLNEPESPLYTASKEELMRWMSEDNLDRSGDDAFRFNLGSKLFTSFRNLGRHRKQSVIEEQKI